jgi:predicted nucleic acid-binding Zn ribbon protein
MQKFSDAPLTVHEDCGGELEKLISTSALKFKGSGWYVNDYGRGGHLPPKERSNGDSSKDSSKGETKSDSKPASGGDSKTPAESKAAPKSESKPAPKPAESR